jgi:pimeloyl-ACP methyl ester carboxylesterase
VNSPRDGMLAQLESGGADRSVVRTGSGPVATLVAGPVDAAPVLLLPGYTGSKEDFGPLLRPLADAGLRVYAIDLPGQFESPGPPDAAAYSTARLATAVREIAAKLGPRVHLLGHSFGGLVARAAVLAGPGAFASLVLMDSGPSAIGGERRARIDELAPLLAESGLAAVYAATQASAASRPDYVPPPAPLAAFLERRFLAGVPAMLQGMGDALRTEPDRVDELAASGVRTLVLYGVGDDAWAPAVQDAMARRLGARRVAIAGAAHSPAVENPLATAAALVAFWQGDAEHVTLDR